LRDRVRSYRFNITLGELEFGIIAACIDSMKYYENNEIHMYIVTEENFAKQEKRKKSLLPSL
jgi:hypothetical protein